MRQVFGMNDNKTLIILKKFNPGIRRVAKERDDKNIIEGMYLDCETTGLSPESDKIINLGYIIFSYDKVSGEILEVLEKFNELEDPLVPLSPVVKKITGFTDEDLKGKKISWNHVIEDFKRVKIIVAHNAFFDRKFLDNKIDISKTKVWACSMDQIDWKGKGHGSRGLEFLAKDHGFFFDGHQAIIDAEVGLYLLSMIDPDTGEPYFQELLRSSRKFMKNIYILNAKTEHKDLIKARGYRWDNDKRAWKLKTFRDSNVEEEFFRKHSYLGEIEIKNIPLEDNFKN